ncbi:LytR/AlgR family response regulator transcription factor [Enterococcus hulanensis]|uniref:LytR/AlgR family response regulator transcription factor n=1 Tax=Enterococcus hulanensis TaxID=2559929 RepID=UPI0010F5935E|nr:LytTR family DNA-binding domain-containing protein [Enterococcus hulanensis]
MKIFVIDDQFVIRKKIIKVIQDLNRFPFEFVEVSNERSFYKELHLLDIADSTLFLIDIELKNYFNGIDLAGKIREKNANCFIVFITSFETYGIEVINRQILPFAYLSKNLPMDQLNAKARQLIDHYLMTIQDRESNEIKITVESNNQKVIVYEKNIIYIATIPGYKKMLLIKLLDGEMLVASRLKSIREQLKAPYFFKELKSFIINLNQIEKIDQTEGFIQFEDQTILDVGISGTRKINQYLKRNGLE